MSPQLPCAVLVHAIAGRARLRFDLQTGDASFFDALALELAQIPTVRELRVTPGTGSLLVLHDGELAPILEQAQARKLFVLVQVAPQAIMRRMRSVIDQVDDRLAVQTGDKLSAGKLAFVALIGAGAWQVSRGLALPAGLTIFDYAYKVMNWVAEREPTMLPPRPDRVAGS